MIGRFTIRFAEAHEEIEGNSNLKDFVFFGA
jgi:hypothetical protein